MGCAGVGWALVRLLWICKHAYNGAEKEEEEGAFWKLSTSETQMSETGLWGGLGEVG